jgi:hypothetical protein
MAVVQFLLLSLADCLNKSSRLSRTLTPRRFHTKHSLLLLLSSLKGGLTTTAVQRQLFSALKRLYLQRPSLHKLVGLTRSCLLETLSFFYEQKLRKKDQFSQNFALWQQQPTTFKPT